MRRRTFPFCRLAYGGHPTLLSGCHGRSTVGLNQHAAFNPNGTSMWSHSQRSHVLTHPIHQWKTHPTRYTDKEWSKEEITTFEEAIQAHGAELRSVRDEVVTRTMPEVVRFYGHWKRYVIVRGDLPDDIDSHFTARKWVKKTNNFVNMDPWPNPSILNTASTTNDSRLAWTTKTPLSTIRQPPNPQAAEHVAREIVNNGGKHRKGYLPTSSVMVVEPIGENTPT